MSNIVKLALRLFVFAFVAAIALALTNEVTKGPIEAQKLAAKMDALNTVLPGCTYTQIEYEGLDENSVLDEIFAGTDANGETYGYAMTAAPQGYGGPIPITVGISNEGHITQVYVGSLQETAGLGSRVGDDAFKEQFIAIAADPDTLRNDVDTIGGATVSSSAFVNAVSDILTYSKNTLGITPKAGDKEAVLQAAAAAQGNVEPVITTNVYEATGFAPMKVEISVDDAGKIVAVAVVEHNETLGFGADLIADAAVFDALVGQDIAGASIDVKAGVTLTSKAINSALKAAGPQVPADPYTVKGFSKFTMDIAVDDGKIASASVATHNETPGFGADLLTEDALAVLVGQDLATAKFDVKSGVTLTSTAINDAIKQAAMANGISVVVAEDDVVVDAEAPTDDETEVAEAGNTYQVTGFQPMKVAIDVDEAGKIVAVSVMEHSETPGFGADLIADTAVFDALVGQDIATAQIDVKSGVTLTSTAINEALKAAAEATPVATEASNEVPTYQVTGFQPMKVAIDVDEAGKIVAVSVVEHNETPSFGADLIADAAVFDALVGQDIATAQIDVKSGVTLTSTAINEALKDAAEATPAVADVAVTVEEEPVATVDTVEIAKTYTIQAKGMSKHPFILSVSVDANGNIVTATSLENSEKDGAMTDDVLSTLVGQQITNARLDTVAGATVTSNAINNALDIIAAHIQREEVQ